MPEVSQETLLAYLHQHGERYTLEALRRTLMDQDFDDETPLGRAGP